MNKLFIWVRQLFCEHNWVENKTPYQWKDKDGNHDIYRRCKNCKKKQWRSPTNIKLWI